MTRVYNVRKATTDDLAEIASLTYVKKSKWFGNKRAKYAAKDGIFKTYQAHRLVVETNEEMPQIVAYAEFRDYPALGPLLSDSWLEWLNHRYCINYPMSWMNTLFFNYCIYAIDHPCVLLDILQLVFHAENRISYVVTVRMPELSYDSSYYAETFDDLGKYAKIFYPREFSVPTNFNTQSLYIIHRYDLLPRIIYRKALPEDNDDIIEIHECELPEMRAELGDFYIAEELMRQDQDAKNNVLIVAEIENNQKELITSGFMWLESDVDVRFYVKNYEMETFGNLIKYNPSKPYAYESIHVLSVEPKGEANLFTADAMDDLEGNTIIGGVQRNDSGVSVTSFSKFKVSSIQGTIVDNSSVMNRFYTYESLYLKFMCIFEKIVTIKYYISQQKKSINLFYNTDGPPNVDGVQNATNVFALKFICCHKDFPLERLFNFLCAMFSVYPDRDYCIMVMPKVHKPLRSHLEALKYFMPVAQRPSEMSNLDEIYITHRSTIFGEISLYRLERTDVETVTGLATNLSKVAHKSLSQSSSFSYSSKVNAFAHSDNELKVIELIIEDVLENEASEFDFFTIRCGNSCKPAKENTSIGFVILRRFAFHHLLRRHYHLPSNDQHLTHERAEIISLKLHPLFTNSCDLIFRNLSSKTKYFDFYFFLGRANHIFTNDLKTVMMPIAPNATKKNWFNTQPTSQKSSKLIEGLSNYDYNSDHLTVFRHKLNPSKYFGNSNRLVIIGFSAECRAFLRQLVFMWNSKDHKNSELYTCLPRLQVTVIAEPGSVEAEFECTFLCPDCGRSKMCFMYYENTCCYVRDVIARMDLRHYVHFVSGHVNFINREQKFVKINKSCEIFYDTLMLMNSTNFNLKTALTFDESGRPPYNFIQLNHRIDRFILFYKVRTLLSEVKRRYRILIYGCNLSTYECISFLITHGVCASQVVLVQPHVKLGTEQEQKFKNPTDDENIGFILDKMADELGVTIHRECTFSHWLLHGASNFIIEVNFTNAAKDDIVFECDIFISFLVGYMDPYVKKWLIDSYIDLKDNRILVNKNFQTNDPDIYAVGKFIEITDPINHQYRFVSERETAHKLMHIMGFRTYNQTYEEKYSQPVLFRAMLPMDYIITKVTMPCRYLASCIITCQKCTISTHYNDTFCRLGFSQKMIVNEIVVVTKNTASLDYLEHFCGKHELMLNSLFARYKAGTIKCLLTFFQEPWTELLMHEDFECFQADNHKMLKPLIQTLQMHKGCEDNHLHEVNQHILEQNLLDFLRKRRQDFHHEFALPEDYTAECIQGTCLPPP